METETIAEVPKYNDDTVAVVVWQPGFNQDTGAINNAPYIHTVNRVDWELQAAPLGKDEPGAMSVLEHLGLYVVKVVHLPNGCRQPNINEAYAKQLADKGLLN